MWMPPNYTAAFLMLLRSMVCWGSWVNSLKMMKGCRRGESAAERPPM